MDENGQTAMGRGLIFMELEEAKRLSDLWHGVEWDPWYTRLGQYIALFSFVELKTHELAYVILGLSAARGRDTSRMQMGALLHAIRRGIDGVVLGDGLTAYVTRLVERLRNANGERNDLVHGLHYLSLRSSQRVRRAISEDLTIEQWQDGAWSMERLEAAYESLRAIDGDLVIARVAIESPHPRETEQISGS
jgi:hypothetical protein